MNKPDLIAEALYDDMQKYITVGDVYNLTPKIGYGHITKDEIEHPAICFGEDNPAVSNIIMTQGNTGNAYYNLVVYGYARWDGIHDTSDIRKLSLDFIRFLYNDYTYKNDVSIGELIINTPGKDDPVASFILPIGVHFDFNLANINLQ